jgi:cell division protein FtsX
MFNLTKRQLICFGGGALIGVPLFFLLRGSAGTTTAAVVMMIAMLPFFLFAMYERNGQPLEQVLRNVAQTLFIRPKQRPYQTNNLYAALMRQERVEKEVRRIVKKDTAKAQS